MAIIKNSDNLKLLHIFREGSSVLIHKKDVVIKEWNNLRFHNYPFPKTKGLGNIETIDVRKGINFPDNSFDAIYTFHISEHINWEENLKFNQELLRILKPNGVCRQSTPDLHSKAVDYLDKMNLYKKDKTKKNRLKYYWSLYTLTDQLARVKTGGEMKKVLRKNEYDIQHLEETHGDVFKPLYSDVTYKKVEFKKNFSYYYYSFIRKVLKITSRNKPKDFLENERFYFDEISYKKIMELSGFSNVDCPKFNQSRIPHWEKYDLDSSEYGDYALEPSVFVEGIKP